MTIKEMQKRAFETSKVHGFWDGLDPLDPVVAAAKLALIHSEISEVLEEIRKPNGSVLYFREDGKPEGIGPELADIMIRMGDFAEAWGIDLDRETLRKMEFNDTRPYKHGKNI